MGDKIQISNSNLIGTVALGSGARSQSSGQSIKTGNVGQFERLKSELLGHGVSEPDIDELQGAIEADATSSDVAAHKFGPRVRAWTKGMLGKAVDAAWQIDLRVAGNILSAALLHYYGWR